MSEPRKMRDRTLRLGDTLLVVDHIIAAKVEPVYTMKADDEASQTIVWLRHAQYPQYIPGDHVATIRSVIEADPHGGRA